jgi:hypothetical protein
VETPDSLIIAIAVLAQSGLSRVFAIYRQASPRATSYPIFKQRYLNIRKYFQYPTAVYSITHTGSLSRLPVRRELLHEMHSKVKRMSLICLGYLFFIVQCLLFHNRDSQLCAFEVGRVMCLTSSSMLVIGSSKQLFVIMLVSLYLWGIFRELTQVVTCIARLRCAVSDSVKERTAQAVVVCIRITACPCSCLIPATLLHNGVRVVEDTSTAWSLQGISQRLQPLLPCRHS